MKHFIEFMVSGVTKPMIEKFPIEAWILPEKTIAYRFIDEEEKDSTSYNCTGWCFWGKEYSFGEIQELLIAEKEILKKRVASLSEKEIEEAVSFLNKMESFQWEMHNRAWNRAVKSCDNNWYPLLGEATVMS